MRCADGQLEKASTSIDLTDVEKALRQSKDSTDKRIEDIMAVFEKHPGVR